jgi:hypothetical protein
MDNESGLDPVSLGDEDQVVPCLQREKDMGEVSDSKIVL